MSHNRPHPAPRTPVPEKSVITHLREKTIQSFRTTITKFVDHLKFKPKPSVLDHPELVRFAGENNIHLNDLHLHFKLEEGREGRKISAGVIEVGPDVTHLPRGLELSVLRLQEAGHGVIIPDCLRAETVSIGPKTPKHIKEAIQKLHKKGQIERVIKSVSISR